MIDKLVLQTGADIPFMIGRLVIHQPSLYEIGLIGGEKPFWQGCDILSVDKKNITNMDKNVIDNNTNFNIIMSIINNKDIEVKKQSMDCMKVLSIIFPNYQIKIGQDKISFFKDDVEGFLDNHNFENFQQIVKDIFVLSKVKGEEYKPANAKAAELAAKMMKGRVKAAASKPKTAATNFIDRYISILSVGEHKNQTDICKLTIYQLFDEFERFQLNLAYEANIKARLAGATGLDEPKNWMEDLQTQNENLTLN